MPISSGTIALSAGVIIELLKFANEMRQIYGSDITDEQIAEAWVRSSVRFQAATEAWKNAPSPSG